MMKDVLCDYLQHVYDVIHHVDGYHAEEKAIWRAYYDERWRELLATTEDAASNLQIHTLHHAFQAQSLSYNSQEPSLPLCKLRVVLDLMDCLSATPLEDQEVLQILPTLMSSLCTQWKQVLILCMTQYK